MYQHYFGLTEAPFSIAPDPRYLYLSQRHQEALAHLLYGVAGEGGFVLITGEVGAGKTTVCRCLLEQIPDTCDVAFIFNPKLTVEELLSTICVEFGITFPEGNASVKVFVDCINRYLLDAHAKGRHTVLIIDEAQNLSAEVLEQMRLLTNLETNERKLLQIILLGQPELVAMLARAELRQLAQRVVARYHLGPLDKSEIAAYVQHRLGVSGAQRALFPAALMGALYRHTQGVPRLINVVCDRALLGAYVQGKERVDRCTLRQAAREVLQPLPGSRVVLRYAVFAAVVLVTGAALALTAYRDAWWKTDRIALTTKAITPIKFDSPRPGATVESRVEPAPPLAMKLEWPASEPINRSETLAHAALFRAWGAEFQGSAPCAQAQRVGLRCKSGRGGLDELRKANRPAVLRLHDDTGAPFYATLLALDGERATFSLAGGKTTVALATLASHWSGEYTFLWRAPPEKSELIRTGSRGATVDWLAQQLSHLAGKKERVEHAVFDANLERQVKQFQVAQGLTPDGAAGPQTLIRLSAVADNSAPALTR